MRLSKPQQRARATIEDLAARKLTAVELGGAIMAALDEALPNDGFRLLGVDNETLLVNQLIAASGNDEWARSEWLRDIYLRADPIPYIELHELMRMGVRAAASNERQDECWGIPRQALQNVSPQRHREAFHELRSPESGTLFGCFPARGRWIAALQVYRRDGAPGFRRTDVAFLERTSRLIGAALADAARRDALAAAQQDAGDAPTGVLILDSVGATQFQSPAGARWLRALGGSDRLLPEAVLAAIARARIDAEGMSVLQTDSALGPVRIEASRADGSTFAVVFTPNVSPTSFAIPATWELTPAEARVVEFALKGLSNAEIAERLYVSPETARTHLRHAYEKAGVRSRNQLMASYFGLLHTDGNPGRQP